MTRWLAAAAILVAASLLHSDHSRGDDVLEEVPERAFRPRRQYKIQEVIKRRQVMLVQVVKEERGNKGAALTTYLSLAGRYTVLMPNTARGGGISRKITNPQDRRRLKSIAQELEVPEGMGLIIRTAGAARTKQEIKRDFEYLLRLWESVRDLTLQSTAPSLVYEEGDLIKRSIRDLYNKDVEEIVVAGDAGHQEAADFMKMLMPSHAKNVKPYKEPEPVFIRYQVERQLARYPVSDEDRLDLVQSTLLQVVRTLGSFRGDSSFTTWLFRVTANEALMLMRSQRRQRARIVEGLDFEELGLLPTVRSTVSEDDAASRAEREALTSVLCGGAP